MNDTVTQTEIILASDPLGEEDISHLVCRHSLGARLRGRTATQRSKKASEKVLEWVLGKGSQKGSEKGVCYGICSKKGF